MWGGWGEGGLWGEGRGQFYLILPTLPTPNHPTPNHPTPQAFGFIQQALNIGPLSYLTASLTCKVTAREGIRGDRAPGC
ncbi:MAG: hypothetical protein F6J93_35140 [Oscillatoria sp. SIO1A7]|nr:hypothetical protein [Oscillatoria sp. SIO1A7]